MATTQLSVIIVLEEFSAYQVENSMVIPLPAYPAIWQRMALSPASYEADITSDDPDVLSTPKKIVANKQIVRKSFLDQSWSEISLASELQAMTLWLTFRTGLRPTGIVSSPSG